MIRRSPQEINDSTIARKFCTYIDKYFFVNREEN